MRMSPPEEGQVWVNRSPFSGAVPHAPPLCSPYPPRHPFHDDADPCRGAEISWSAKTDRDCVRAAFSAFDHVICSLGPLYTPVGRPGNSPSTGTHLPVLGGGVGNLCLLPSHGARSSPFCVCDPHPEPRGVGISVGSQSTFFVFHQHPPHVFNKHKKKLHVFVNFVKSEM